MARRREDPRFLNSECRARRSKTQTQQHPIEVKIPVPPAAVAAAFGLPAIVEESADFAIIAPKAQQASGPVSLTVVDAAQAHVAAELEPL